VQSEIIFGRPHKPKHFVSREGELEEGEAGSEALASSVEKSSDCFVSLPSSLFPLPCILHSPNRRQWASFTDLL
jgi:hypothetical protein